TGRSNGRTGTEDRWSGTRLCGRQRSGGRGEAVGGGGGRMVREAGSGGVEQHWALGGGSRLGEGTGASGERGVDIGGGMGGVGRGPMDWIHTVRLEGGRGWMRAGWPEVTG